MLQVTKQDQGSYFYWKLRKLKLGVWECSRMRKQSTRRTSFLRDRAERAASRLERTRAVGLTRKTQPSKQETLNQFWRNVGITS